MCIIVMCLLCLVFQNILLMFVNVHQSHTTTYRSSTLPMQGHVTGKNRIQEDNTVHTNRPVNCTT
jgi:hypothetical protein